MDLINPYMRHHSFASSQSSSPGAVGSRGTPPPHTHVAAAAAAAAAFSNGFVDHVHHSAAAAAAAAAADYQNIAAVAAANRDNLLEYNAAAAYAANAAAAAAAAAAAVNNNNNNTHNNNNNNHNSNNNHNNNNNNNNNNILSNQLMLLKSAAAAGVGSSPKRHREESNSPAASAGASERHVDVGRLHSESPDNCHNRHVQRYENSSPGLDSCSQRSSEETGANSESSPPPADYSPENLSAGRKTLNGMGVGVGVGSYVHNQHGMSQSQLSPSSAGSPMAAHNQLHTPQGLPAHMVAGYNNNNYSHHNNMLEGKLGLSFLGPPLAALHSMAEMKNGVNVSNVSMNGCTSTSNYGGGGQLGGGHLITDDCRRSTSTTTTTHTQANPHGIDTILSRPPPVTSAGLSALTGGSIPRFTIAAAAAGMAQYLSQSPLKTHGGHIDRTHLYWPGLQGLVANPMAWRERLSNTSKLKEEKKVKIAVKSSIKK